MLLAVTFPPKDAERVIVSDVIGGTVDIRYLTDLDDSERRDALTRADVVLTKNTGKELRSEELLALLRHARLIQFLSAGLDYISLKQLPANVPVAKNAGGWTEPMAEDTLAMALAAAKRLLIENQNLAHGKFNQFTQNKLLRGCICGIFGFGGNGIAAARLMRCVGMGNRKSISGRRQCPNRSPGHRSSIPVATSGPRDR